MQKNTVSSYNLLTSQLRNNNKCQKTLFAQYAYREFNDFLGRARERDVKDLKNYSWLSFVKSKEILTYVPFHCYKKDVERFNRFVLESLMLGHDKDETVANCWEDVSSSLSRRGWAVLEEADFNKSTLGFYHPSLYHRVKDVPAALFRDFDEKLSKDILDAVSFDDEFKIVQDVPVKERTTQFVLRYKNGDKYVTKAAFNAATGKYVREGKTSVKLIKQSLTAVVKGVQMLIKGLAALGSESSEPVLGKPMFFELVRLLLDSVSLFESSFSMAKVGSVLMSLYSVCSGVEIWIKQSLDALTMSAMSLFLPTTLFEIVKRMSVFTSAKFLDDVSLFSNLFNSIIDFVKHCVSYLPAVMREGVLSVLEALPFGEQYQIFHEASKLVKKWKDSKVAILNGGFRESVKRLQGRISQHTALNEWVRRSNGVKVVLDDFKSLYKSVLCYDSTRRVEPVCFAFEGPAGVFKSVLMNKVVTLFRRHPKNPRTVFTHTVKSVKDGKDFYDTYNNEDLFILDDLFQQGVSQGRSLMNWVSEVKYPLDCAEAHLKNTKFFNSSIILFTANNFSNIETFTKDDCIASKDALFRRSYVFDFSDIIRDGSVLSGSVKFKWWDTSSQAWRNSNRHDSTDRFGGVLEASCNASNQKALMSWMYFYIYRLEARQQSLMALNELSDKDIEDITTEIIVEDTYLDPQSWLIESILDSSKFCTDYISSSLYYAYEYLCSGLTSLIDFKNKFIYGAVSLFVILLSYYFYSSKSESVDLDPQALIDELVDKMREFSRKEKPSTIVTSLEDSVKYVIVHDSQSHICVGLVSGHCVVLPAHITAEPNVALSIYADSGARNLILDHSLATRIYQNIDEDVCIFQFNNHIASVFKNQWDKFTMTRSADTIIFPGIAVDIHKRIMKSRDFNYLVFDEKKQDKRLYISSNNALNYDFGFKGMCGSMVANKDGVLGMHVAGGRFGASIVWSVKTTLELMKILRADNKFVVDIPVKPVDAPMSATLLEVDKQYSVIKDTSIIPTKIYGALPVTRSPANLRAFGKDTLSVRAKKSFMPVGDIDSSDLNFSREWLESIIPSYRSLTIEEVIRGTPELAGLNKKSSNGYGCAVGKEIYVDFLQGKLTPRGQDMYDEVVGRLKSGTFNLDDVIWVECLKDELRNDEKVDKPRTFRCCTVIMQILAKQCFGDLVAQVQRNKWSTGIMIGINPLKDWPKLFSKISERKYKWGADFGDWDGKMPTQLQETAAGVLLGALQDDDLKIVAGFILYNMAHCFVLIRDSTYLLTHSMPSGHFLTAFLNSVINRMLTACWYSNLCRKKDTVVSHVSFNKDFFDAVYGDDKLMSSDIDGFDMISMAEYFESIGLQFTNSKKGKCETASEDWKDITFLKRSFVYSNKFQRIVCPLDLRTLYSSMSWYDSRKDAEVVLQGKLNAFQREAYLHLDYIQLMQMVCAKCDEVGVYFDFLSDQQLDLLVREADQSYYYKNHQTFEEI